MTAVADASETPAPKRGVNGAYARLMRRLSLRHPSLWRLRVDLLALAGVAGLLLTVIAPKLILDVWVESTFGGYHAVGDYPIDPATGQTDYSQAAAIVPPGEVAAKYAASTYVDVMGGASALFFLGFALFGIFWLYSLLQPVRLRRVGRFQNKPGYSIILFGMLWFLLWPALILYVTDLSSWLVTHSGVEGPLRLASGVQKYPFVTGAFLGWIFVSAATAALLTLFVKSILLSSLIRAIGAFFLAFAIFTGVCGVGYVVIGAPILVSQAMDSAFSTYALTSTFSSSMIAIPIGSAITLGAIWIVSVLLLRSRANVWRRIGLVVVTLIAGACLFFATGWLASKAGENFYLGEMNSGSAALIVLMFVAAALGYLIPHVVAIGGDLRNGARSRLTRPVLLSCFWSAPTAIITGVMVLTTWLCDTVFKIEFPAKSLALIGALGVGIGVSVVVVELFSRLTAHISSLPEP